MSGCITNNSLSVLWYRKDLLEEAGLNPPTNWDELLNVAKKTTKGDTFGTVLPYKKSGMANRIVDLFVHQAGGWIINPDLSVGFNSPETVRALEFCKEMREYCPDGANNYSYAEVVGGFVSGACATSMYTGRVLINVDKQNPSLHEKVSCAPYPYPEGGRPFWICGFDSLFIPVGAKNSDAAKKFAQALWEADGYINYLHATPGHLMPTLKSIAKSEKYNSHPLLKRYKPEVAVMAETTGKAKNLLRPSAEHKFVFKSGEIYGANVFAETLQRVIVEGTSPKKAAEIGADKIAKIMKG